MTVLSLKILCKSINFIPLLINCNFDKMAFMVDLRIDIRSKEILNITLCQKCCSI